MALIACAVVLGVVNGADAEAVGFPLAMTASALVGGLVASRRPANPVGWSFLGSAALVALQTFATEYATYGLLSSLGALPFVETAAWVSVWIELLGPGLMLVVLPFFFPDGRLVSPGWRSIVWLVFLALVANIVLRLLTPGVVVYATTRIANPLGVEALRPYLGALSVVGAAMWLGCIFVAVASLVVRFRRSRSEERQQIKWLALAALVVPVWFLTNAPIEAASPDLFQVVDALIVFALIPVAAGVAILRHRLYDIDLLINRALVYGSLTAALALFYVGSVVGRPAIRLSRPHGAGVHPSRRGFHPGHSRPVQPTTPPGAGVRGPPLLQTEVRCRKDPRGLRLPVARRDRSRGLEQRPGGGSKKNRAARSRLSVATPRCRARGQERRPQTVRARVASNRAIHRSAWKGCSPNFALRGFYEVRYPKQCSSNTKDSPYGGCADAPAS
jgi:hypothetical protein